MKRLVAAAVGALAAAAALSGCSPDPTGSIGDADAAISSQFCGALGKGLDAYADLLQHAAQGEDSAIDRVALAEPAALVRGLAPQEVEPAVESFLAPLDAIEAAAESGSAISVDTSGWSEARDQLESYCSNAGHPVG